MLQFLGSQRVGPDLATEQALLYAFKMIQFSSKLKSEDSKKVSYSLNDI